MKKGLCRFNLSDWHFVCLLIMTSLLYRLPWNLEPTWYKRRAPYMKGYFLFPFCFKSATVTWVFFTVTGVKWGILFTELLVVSNLKIGQCPQFFPKGSNLVLIMWGTSVVAYDIGLLYGFHCTGTDGYNFVTVI